MNITDTLIQGIKNIHQIGRQKCFELGNPYYCKEQGDGEHYTKELPTGEKYLVNVEILYDETGSATGIKDEILKVKENAK